MNTFKVVAMYGIGLVFCKSTGLILQPYVTEHLGLAAYGKLDVLVVLTTLLSLIVTFGIVDGLYRFCHDSSDLPRLFSQALSFIFVICVLVLGGATLFAHEIQTLLPGPPPLFALYCFLITIFVNALIAIPLAKLRIENNVTRFVLIQVMITVIQAAFILALTPFWQINGIAAAGVIAQIAGVFLLYREWPRLCFTFDPVLVRYGAVLTVSGLLGFISFGAERWAIAHYLGVDEVSLYAIAVQWGVAASLLIEPFVLWWFPKRFSLVHDEEEKQKLADITILACQLCVLIAAIIIIIGPIFLRFWLNETFHYSSVLLPFVAIWLMLKSCCMFLNVGCYYNEEGKGILLINTLTTVLSLAVFVWIIPQFGVLVLIGCCTVIQALRLATFYFYSQQHFPLTYPLTALFISFVLLTFLFIAQQYAFFWGLGLFFSLLCVHVFWPWRHLFSWRYLSQVDRL